MGEHTYFFIRGKMKTTRRPSELEFFHKEFYFISSLWISDLVNNRKRQDVIKC